MTPVEAENYAALARALMDAEKQRDAAKAALSAYVARVTSRAADNARTVQDLQQQLAQSVAPEELRQWKAHAAEMRALLARIVDDDPIYNDPEDGPFCTFCGKHWSYSPNATPTHADDCTYVAAHALLDRIDGVPNQ